MQLLVRFGKHTCTEWMFRKYSYVCHGNINHVFHSTMVNTPVDSSCSLSGQVMSFLSVTPCQDQPHFTGLRGLAGWEWEKVGTPQLSGSI